MYLPVEIDSDGLSQNLGNPVLTGVAAVLRKALVVWFGAWCVCVWAMCVLVFYL